MSYSTSPFNPDQKYKGQVKSELKQADDNFNILAQAFKNNDPTTGIVNHALVADSCNNCSGSGGGSSVDIGVVSAGSFSNNFNPDAWLTDNYITGINSNIKYFIQDTAPNYDSSCTTIWYNTNNNVIYIITKEGYNLAFNWKHLPIRDIWYGIGKLKIENGVLKISNDGNNWLPIYSNILSSYLITADDTNSNDDSKIGYVFGDAYFQQKYWTNPASYSKLRVACVSPSKWDISIPQHTNQSTAGWFGIHLGDIDISDGQGKMTSNGSNFDTSNYSDISNAKFLPLGWFPVSGSDGSSIVVCDATITITIDNKITVSSKVYNINDSNNYAYFSCSGTFPSSANYFGTIVLNGDTYTTSWYEIVRRYDDNSIKLNTAG